MTNKLEAIEYGIDAIKDSLEGDIFDASNRCLDLAAKIAHDERDLTGCVAGERDGILRQLALNRIDLEEAQDRVKDLNNYRTYLIKVLRAAE